MLVIVMKEGVSGSQLTILSIGWFSIDDDKQQPVVSADGKTGVQRNHGLIWGNCSNGFYGGRASNVNSRLDLA